MAVRYGPRYPCGIGIFDLVVIQGSVRTDFLIKCCWEPTPYSPFLHAKLFTIQLEAGWGGHIWEDKYPETQWWLQTDSCIREVCKFMSANHIHVSHLGTDVWKPHTYDACITTHLTLNGDFTTSELRTINQFCMSKGIFFINQHM